MSHRGFRPISDLARTVDDALTLGNGFAPRHLGHIARLLAWKLRGDRYARDCVPAGLGPKFVSARRSAELIDDDATVLASGFGAFHVPSVLLWALRDRFRETAHPTGLTLCTVAGVGGRGRAHGTIEELALPGLATTVLMGHAETARAFLALADAGHTELHTLPQGQLAFLLEALGDGVSSLSSRVGVGTFLDPRVGAGSAVLPNATEQFVTVDGDQLRYRMPAPDVLLCSASAADHHGNLYLRSAAMLGDLYDGARAVHARGGTVIASVAKVIRPDPAAIYVPADWVDAIVVSDQVSQFHSVPQRKSWSFFGLGSNADTSRAQADLRFTNLLSGAASRRTPADGALARVAASMAAPHLTDGALINVGVGLPEEVGQVLHHFFGEHLTLSTEAGAVGGLPASGMFFGAAVHPRELLRPTDMFRRYRDELALTCLGMLELDGDGNVNVSRRGRDAKDYVGPGGFLDIAEHAETVVFVGSFATGERLRVNGDSITVDRQGIPKLVSRVQEVTFNGHAALARGQRVYYATHRAVFGLTSRGLELTHVMPGIDVHRDVLSAPAHIQLPIAGIAGVKTHAPQIVTGHGYELGTRPANSP